MRGITIILSLIAGLVVTGCVGVNNQTGAQFVDASSLNSGQVAKADCHYETFKKTITTYVQAQCVSCHAANQGGLLLAGGSDEGTMMVNYQHLLDEIDAGVNSADQTLLLKKITSGSGISHSFQRPSSDQLVLDFNDFVQGIISDPSCSATTATGGTGTGNTCLDANCFF